MFGSCIRRVAGGYFTEMVYIVFQIVIL